MKIAVPDAPLPPPDVEPIAFGDAAGVIADDVDANAGFAAGFETDLAIDEGDPPAFAPPEAPDPAA